jgi:hypothetical protein
MISLKKNADGKCGICNEQVPPSNLNKFYCSESCRIEAWKFFHPDEDEPDWNSLPRVMYF